MSDGSGEDIARRLKEYRPEAIAYIREGLAVASRLPSDNLSDILEQLISDFRKGKHRIRGSVLVPLTGLGPRDAERLASAYSLIVGLLSESDVAAVDFIEASRGILFNTEDEQAAYAIVTLACEHRGEIKAGIARAQLAASILPSMLGLDIEVDVRVRVTDGAINTAAAVAVVHLDTDADGQEIWFQLSQADVEEMVKKLNEALTTMAVAEAAVLGGR